MLDYAAAKAAAYPEISFQQHDIFSAKFQQQPYDVLTCQPVLPPFPRRAVGGATASVAAAGPRIAVVINDLHRHPLAYYGIRWLTRLLRGSYLVQHDAPLSVARAFTRRDWQRLLAAAGITHYALRWRWAFRWQVVVVR